MEVRDADRERLKLQKEDAVAAVWEMVAIFEAEDRDPDAWERACLRRAMSDLFSGLYEPALKEVFLARTPKDQRSRSAVFPTDAVAAKVNAALIRKVMAHVAAEPLRYPHLGPVELI